MAVITLFPELDLMYYNMWCYLMQKETIWKKQFIHLASIIQWLLTSAISTFKNNLSYDSTIRIIYVLRFT